MLFERIDGESAQKLWVEVGRFLRQDLACERDIANLLDSRDDDPEEVQAWRTKVRAHGIWANDPVPLFPYPGSPDYTRRWGVPDDLAWERAHDAYLNRFTAFSDIQDQQPLPLIQLESYEPRHA